MEKVILGLSGGVDSAVAALLLKREYEVYGLYLDIGLGGSGAEDAAAVAAALGAAYVATGHYARAEDGLLKKGMPPNDQSYMLARLTRDQLRRVLFPLGGYEKTQVRALAEESGLPVARKPDSMEICFIPDGDYSAWMARRGAVPPPGDFVAPDGTVLGRHRGFHCYTLGQGRGLGVSGPHRYFVSAIRPAANQVVLSDGSDLGRTSVRCESPNWIGADGLKESLAVTVRLRHSRTEAPAVIVPGGEGVEIRLEAPARAPTPGQLAVFYQGDTVVGSGWIV